MTRIARLAATCLASASAVALATLIADTRALAHDDHDDDAVIHTHYDGTTNDLLTAGLGRSGLGSATAPGVGSTRAR
jgi:hydroxybutyrate-dimer hydrolase